MYGGGPVLSTGFLKFLCQLPKKFSTMVSNRVFGSHFGGLPIEVTEVPLGVDHVANALFKLLRAWKASVALALP
ncbi:hypothetical protein D3C86_2111040 [compost metagenome]